MKRGTALVAIAAGFAVDVTVADAASRAPVRALGDIPLVDQSGRAFHMRNLAGHPAAIAFVASRCRDTCPIVNAVFERLAHSGARVPLVTISLDPAYDTPIVMSSLAREMNANAPAWRFVTGRPVDVGRVLDAFGVVLERGSDGIPDAHSDFIYVLDRYGRLAQTLLLSTNSVAQLRAIFASAML